MHHLLKLFLLISSFNGLCSCNSDQLKEKTFKKEIVLAKVEKKIDIHRGDFLIVCKENNHSDTIPIYRYSNYFDKIDNETMISKKSMSYTLELHNIKSNNGTRYDESINLIYW